MRGKEGLVRRRGHRVGITPAHAGKRNGQSPTMLLRRDHPRVCGEKNAILSGRKTEPGSPPRMRGKAAKCSSTCPALGITPAYAGKRKASGRHQHCGEDHPRVCGEKKRTVADNVAPQGSPPRMRGKASLAQIEECNDGITPAYAGKRKASGRHQHCGEDHPRVCGEKKRTVADNVAPQGSPPRMRGKERYFVWQEDGTGITPAYAGKRPPA